MHSEKVERKTLAQDLKEAVRTEALMLYFQPITDLRTCQLTGFEALLRWHDPVRGAIPPSTFIPIAEETGVIGPLGCWVLREACRRAATWPGDIRVAVNLSAVQMQLCDVAAEVEAALAETGLPASRLEIEVTESVLLDHPSAGKTLHRLVALGVSVSLDDFGTGYSSLNYLCSFPFDRIKIDRSFVARMLENKDAAAIVETVRDLGHRLGMGITAEGIESYAQLRRLQEMGCDAGQGYLISRPMPAHEVLRFTETFSLSIPVRTQGLNLHEAEQARVA
jgi:EAL domain-containing protein (putative c-di-GMP-specific phosphodiesterase class I)